MYLELKLKKSDNELEFTFKATESEFADIADFFHEQRCMLLEVEKKAPDAFTKKFIDLVDRFRKKSSDLRKLELKHTDQTRVTKTRDER